MAMEYDNLTPYSGIQVSTLLAIAQAAAAWLPTLNNSGFNEGEPNLQHSLTQRLQRTSRLDMTSVHLLSLG